MCAPMLTEGLISQVAVFLKSNDGCALTDSLDSSYRLQSQTTSFHRGQMGMLGNGPLHILIGE